MCLSKWGKCIDLLPLSENNEKILHIATIIFGTVRVSKPELEDFIKFENEFKTHNISHIRGIYFFSYVVTFSLSTLDIQLLDKLTHDIGNDDDNEISKYEFFRRLMVFFKKDSRFKEYYFEWLRNNCINLNDEEKNIVIQTIFIYSYSFNDFYNQNIGQKINEIFETIKTFKIEDINIWGQIDQYLCNILEHDNKIFDELMQIIISNNPFFVKLYDKSNNFFLLHELKDNGYNSFLLDYLISDNITIRDAGYELVQQIGLSIDESIRKNKLTEKQLRIILCNIKIKFVVTENISDILLTIEPLFNDAKDSIKDDFIEEMVIQAVNYKGKCLEYWKSIEEKTDILTEVIKRADNYFSGLEKTRVLSANSFIYSEVKKGHQVWSRNFSNEISKNAKKYSIFLKEIRETHTLYGDKICTYLNDGKISDTRDFGNISQSFEFPRLELLDPEGMAFRRIKAREELNSVR